MNYCMIELSIVTGDLDKRITKEWVNEFGGEWLNEFNGECIGFWVRLCEEMAASWSEWVRNECDDRKGRLIGRANE